MSPPPKAWLLDLTRLVSRLGRGPLTGVDRVELAYLSELLNRPEPLFALVRTRLGFVLLDRVGADAIKARAIGAPLGGADLLGRLLWRGNPLRARAEADLRRLALARCPRWGLSAMLRRHLPTPVAYLNTGHANLTDHGLQSLRRVPGLRIAVLVHDAIPLDYPQYTRAGMSAVFARKMAAVSRHADRVIYSTNDARQRVEAHFARMGRVPPAVVAALGVASPPVIVPKPRPRPYFVAIGTIEPRKNYGFLLDLWQALPQRLPPEQMPDLLILGHRGWADPALFARLDAAPPHVTVLEGLPDDAVFSLLLGAQALLFPSLAEGFGLPPVEAAALGVPVFASALPVLQEILGDYPVYLPATDSYSWLETIRKSVQAGERQADHKKQRQVTTRDAHFNTVLKLA